MEGDHPVADILLLSFSQPLESLKRLWGNATRVGVLPPYLYPILCEDLPNLIQWGPVDDRTSILRSLQCCFCE